MSRFVGAFNIGGDDSSSEDDRSEDSDQAVDNQPAANAKVSKYIVGSDDEDEVERTFKLGVDKKWEALEKILDDVRKHANIADFNSLDNDLPKLAGEIEKQSATLFKEKGDKLPSRVLKVMMLFEDTINEVTGAMKKKMTKINASSYNKLKQKYKKWLQGTNEGQWLYETQLAKYREDPQDSEEEKKEEEKDEESEEEKNESESEEEEEDDDEDQDTKAAADGAAQQAAAEKGADNEYGDEYGDEYYDEEGADGEEDEDLVAEGDSKEINAKLRSKYSWLWKTREEMTATERRWKWVKVESYPEELKTLIEMLKSSGKKKKTAAQNQDHQHDGDDEDKQGATQKDDADNMTQIKRDFLSMDFTVFSTVSEILQVLKEERLKSKYSADFHCQVLRKIYEEMPCVEEHEVKARIEVIIYLVGTIFQSVKGTSFLSRDQWVSVYGLIQDLLTQAKSPEFFAKMKEAHETPETPEVDKEGESEEENQEAMLEMLEAQNKFDTERSIFPSLSTFLERMDENLWKSYQKLASKSSGIDYLNRINDENKLLFLIDETMDFLSQFDLSVFKARISLIKLQYIYYKNDSIYLKMKKRIEAKGGAAQLKGIYFVENSAAEIVKIVEAVQQHGQPKMRVKATLLQVYHMALHNNAREARDLLKKTHIGGIIQMQHVDNQILYNRTIAQIGMAYFRMGKISESHEVLVEIFQNPRYRELLAQGVARHFEKTAEQELEEKRRLIPAHMSMNLQTLESIHYITSMLIEIPMMSENQHSMKNMVVSKQYRRLIELYDNKQAFVLEAQQSKDHIVFAARALNKSDWQTALKHIRSINAITRIPEYESGTLQATLDFGFKKAAMMTFLFQAAKQYRSFSFDKLASSFALDKKQVRQIISKLILQNRVQAKLDLSADLLILDQKGSDVQELQQLSLQYVSQIQSMVNQNERVLEVLNYQQELAGKAVRNKAQQAEKHAAAAQGQQ